MEAHPQAAKTQVNSPRTPWLEVKNSEMEAVASLRHSWRANEPLTPDLQQITMGARSKLCSLSSVVLKH